MSPENAKVYIIEDDSSTAEMIKNVVEHSGHEVVGQSDNFEDAMTAVEKEFDQKEVQVVTLDKNLDSVNRGKPDGEIILESIRKNHPEIKVVGMSTDKLPDTDRDLGKIDLVDAGKVIKDL